MVYPNASKWLTKLNMEINMVDPDILLDTIIGFCANIKILIKETHVFETNLQKQKLSEYDLKFKLSNKNGINTLPTRRQ